MSIFENEINHTFLYDVLTSKLTTTGWLENRKNVHGLKFRRLHMQKTVS
jgi:hypothetical protein